MNVNSIILVIITLLFMGACTNYAIEELGEPQSKGEIFEYKSIGGGIENIIVDFRHDTPEVLSLDLILPSKIIWKQSVQSEVLLEVDWYTLSFYLPPDYKQYTEWNREACSYRIIGKSVKYGKKSRENSYDHIIEQKCTNSLYKIIYMYSDTFGLQSFFISKIDKSESEQSFFVDAYYLYGQSFGFAAMSQ